MIAQRIILNPKGDEKIVTLPEKKQIWEESRLQHGISSEFCPGVEIQTAEERTTSKRLIQTRENQSRRGQTRSNIEIGTYLIKSAGATTFPWNRYEMENRVHRELKRSHSIMDLTTSGARIGESAVLEKNGR